MTIVIIINCLPIYFNIVNLDILKTLYRVPIRYLIITIVTVTMMTVTFAIWEIITTTQRWFWFVPDPVSIVTISLVPDAGGRVACVTQRVNHVTRYVTQRIHHCFSLRHNSSSPMLWVSYTSLYQPETMILLTGLPNKQF